MGVMPTIDQVVHDIKSLKIQGATNVALASLDALAHLIRERPSISCYELTRIGERLAFARPTEPLAQNAIRYVSQGCTNDARERIEQYKGFIEYGKRIIPGVGADLLVDGGVYLTICHSSTVVHLFEEARKTGAYFSLYVAETRPRYQGRITAKELLDAGFDDVTMIVDDVAVSLIEGRRGTVDAVFIGADLLTQKGFVNKIGSLAVVAAAYRKKIPVYVVSTLLKYDPLPFSPTHIEQRSYEEIWPDAPDNLLFYAPAFDYVPFFGNVKIISEVGIITGRQLKTAAAKRYPFIFDRGYDKKLYYGKSL